MRFLQQRLPPACRLPEHQRALAERHWRGSLQDPRLRWYSSEPAGERLVWVDRSVANLGRTSVAVVSSRVGRKYDQRPAWCAAIAQFCRQPPNDGVLLAAERTTTDRLVRHAATRFARPLIRIEVAANWKAFRESSVLPADLSRVCLSPSLADDSSPQGARPPLQDEALFAWADDLLVLHLRPGGWVEQLVGWRLAEGRRVSLVTGAGLVSVPIAGKWAARGAARVEAPSPPPTAPRPLPTVPTADLPAGPWLTHWTRGCPGPWPGETEAEYLDGVLLDPWQQDRSPAASLERILKQDRIRASRTSVRGGVAMVSFTAVQPEAFADHRTFQPHRHRWDFEPYAIAIRREWLQQRGARAVQYGSDSDWQALDAEQRRFFQHEGRRGVWRREREWRHPGDVRLDELSSDDAVVLVPDAAVAARLAPLSRWPLVVLSS